MSRADVLKHAWFAPCDTALPSIAVDKELMEMPDTDEDAAAYIRAVCRSSLFVGVEKQIESQNKKKKKKKNGNDGWLSRNVADSIFCA